MFKLITKYCESCGRDLVLHSNRDIQRKRFCSRACAAKSGKMGNPWDNPDTATMMRLHMRKPHTLTEAALMAQKDRALNRIGKRFNSKEIVCAHCGKLFDVPMSRIDGRVGQNGQIANRKYCSILCKNLASRKPDELKTGKTLLKEWRIKVFERDNYICQKCGCKRKRLLQAHHLKDKGNYPELAHNIENGLTLCVYCHIKQHKLLPVNFMLSSLKLSGLRRPYESTVV